MALHKSQKEYDTELASQEPKRIQKQNWLHKILEEHRTQEPKRREYNVKTKRIPCDPAAAL